MKIMLNHSSATPHTIKSSKKPNLNVTSKKTISRSTSDKTLSPNGTSKRPHINALKQRNGTTRKTISNALKRRAQSLIKDRSIDAESRAIIRYGLETNDPWLPELVRRVDAGEPILDTAGQLIIETSAPGSL